MPIDDSLVLTEGATGALIATDKVTVGSTTSHYQYVKVAFGTDGSAKSASTTSGAHLPVQLYNSGTAVGTNSDALKVNLASSSISLNVVPTGGTLDHVGVTGNVAASVTGDVAVSGTVGITYDDGVTFDVTGSSVTVSNTVAVSGTALGITYDDGVTFDVTGSQVTVGGSVAVTGTALGVTGDVAVSATDLDIRGISGGTVGYTGDIGSNQDSIIVQGVTGAFPVGTLLHGASAGGPNGIGYRPIGSSGDALKVALTDATINATVNVGAEVSVGSNGTYLQVSGSSAGSSHLHPVIVGGKAGVTAIGVALHGVCAGATIDVTGSRVKISSGTVTATVTATDLDIRGLTMGARGYTGATLTNMDSVVVQGVSGAYPVGNILYGISTGTDSPTPIALEVDFLNNKPTLKTVLDSRGQTNATALQIQGRVDGLTLQPVYIAGVGDTGDVSPIEGLVGVSFDVGTNGFIIAGGETAPVSGSKVGSVACFLHGLCGATGVVPIGVCMDSGGDYAIKTHLANADGVTFDVTVASSVMIGNTLGTAVPIMGACASPQNYGVFVTGKAGSPNPWPIMVQGYNAAGSSPTDGVHPIGITLAQFEKEVVGLTGALTHIMSGVSGACLELQSIDGTLTTISDAIGTDASTSIQDDLSSAKSHLNTVKGDVSSVIAAESGNPENRVFVNVPAPTTFISEKKTANSAAQAFSNAAIKSGARVKLHPEATGIVFVGRTGVASTNWYPLAAGEDVFIEVNNTDLISVIADASGGSNLDVFLLGF